MRVISGKARGFKLKSLKGKNTRPTTDKVKESLFNIINRYIYNSNVLDLFAGTGALGIEALSRGAKHCVFVDKSYNAISIIKENLAHTNLSEQAKVIRTTWKDYFTKYFDEYVKYDIILLDPPYGQNMITPVLQAINELDILSSDGVIVTETDINDNIPVNEGALNNIFNRKYGRTNINLFSKGEDEL